MSKGMSIHNTTATKSSSSSILYNIKHLEVPWTKVSDVSRQNFISQILTKYSILIKLSLHLMEERTDSIKNIRSYELLEQ